MKHHVKIAMPGTGGRRADIEVDGQQLGGVTDFSVEHTVKAAAPKVHFGLAIVPFSFEGKADVRIHMRDVVRDSLILLGWTPPAEPAE